MKEFIEFAPIIIVVLVFLLQQKIVVTPEQLERKHREILEDTDERYAPLISVSQLRGQVGEMKEKIDKIYDMLLAGS